MPATETTTAAQIKEASLQERLTKIESLITEAHVKVSGMAPMDDAKEAPPASDRAGDTANRCIGSLNELVERLTLLAERVGYI